MLRLLIGCIGLVLCCQDLGLINVLVLADDAAVVYHHYPDQKLTWDEANDFCRDRNLAMPFTFSFEELKKLREFIALNKIDPAADYGYWMGGRADNNVWRWDFGTKAISFNGWNKDEEGTFRTRGDGAVQACMQLTKPIGRFTALGLGWSNMWCDEKRGVICQTYE